MTVSNYKFSPDLESLEDFYIRQTESYLFKLDPVNKYDELLTVRTLKFSPDFESV